MKKIGIVCCACVLLGWRVRAEGNGKREGYVDTPKLPSGWHVHDPARPQPPVVTPGKYPGDPPSDAIVLFDGQDVSAWTGIPDKKKNPAGEMLWKVENGALVRTHFGDVQTKQAFGDCQLHIEWQTEARPEGHGQSRCNSGVFLMGLYEIQILDSYENETYADGAAGAIYGQTPSLVNANKKPGEWQYYDVVFRAPRFDKSGKLLSPACMTVFFNGVLIHDHVELMGPTEWRKLAKYRPHPAKLPLRLQDHPGVVRFRNVWIRPLDLGTSDDGMKTDAKKGIR